MSRGWGAAILAAGLFAAPAEGDVLCRAGSGRLFHRASCKPHETALELPAGQQGTPGPAAATTGVVDSTGRPVGLFASAGRDDAVLTVVLEARDRLVSFAVDGDGFLERPAYFLHADARCEDPPLLATRPLIRSGLVDGGIAFYAEDPIAPRAIVAQERPPSPTCGSALALPNGNCCFAVVSPALMTGVATRAFEVGVLGLTPPFRLQP